MSLLEHAKTELKAAGYTLDETEDEYNAAIVESILDLIELFSNQGHSGFTAPYCIGVFAKLASWEPLGPLTGEDSEWTEVSDGVFQNKRCSRVFKGLDGKAYDVEGKVFVEPNGAAFTSNESRVYVEFPYTPTTEEIKVEV